MVLFFITELGLKTTLFVGEQLWNIGKWAIYGKQKSKEEILLERENELLEKIAKLEEKELELAEEQRMEIQELKRLITESKNTEN